MTKFKAFLIGAAAFCGATSMTAAANAAIITLIPVEPGTISDTITFAKAGPETFKFTIDAPFTYTFTLTEGLLSFTQTGGAGTVVDTIPVTAGGSVSYVLTTAVAEPATWALMLAGVGGMGAAMRMRRRTATAIA